MVFGMIILGLKRAIAEVILEAVWQHCYVYKPLLLVEQFFRAAKSLLDTRAIFQQWDALIQGDVFCFFLALVPVYPIIKI